MVMDILKLCRDSLTSHEMKPEKTHSCPPIAEVHNIHGETVTASQEDAEIRSYSDQDSISTSSIDSDPGENRDRYGRGRLQSRTLYHDISAHIKSLYNVSKLMRRPTYEDTSLRSEWDRAADLHGTQESYDYNHCFEKLKQWRGIHQVTLNEDIVATIELLHERRTAELESIDETCQLVRRLARANSIRREQLLFWNELSDRQSSNRQSPETFDGDDQLEISSRKHPEDTSQQRQLVNIHQFNDLTLPLPLKVDAISKSTKNTDMSFSNALLTSSGDKAAASTVSSPIYADSKCDASTSRSRVPDVPVPFPGTDLFVCPYCLTELDHRVMDRITWE